VYKPSTGKSSNSSSSSKAVAAFWLFGEVVVPSGVVVFVVGAVPAAGAADIVADSYSVTKFVMIIVIDAQEKLQV
jgi:hypothetical protein